MRLFLQWGALSYWKNALIEKMELKGGGLIRKEILDGTNVLNRSPRHIEIPGAILIKDVCQCLKKKFRVAMLHDI